MKEHTQHGLISDIILVDIINFSKLTAKQQLEIITFLTKSYRRVIEKMLLNSNMNLRMFILGFIPTGDGFYCILNPRLKGFGTILALSFNHFSNQIEKKYNYFEGIKIAVHTGKVFEFNDILGNKNYIGDGLNSCSRYLGLEEYIDSTVIVSQSAFESLTTFLDLHKDYDTLLAQREFRYSDIYTFYDKHHIEKQARLVWLRKTGIINPPNIYFNSLL